MSIFQCMMADIAEVVSYMPGAAKAGIVYGIVMLAVCLAAGEMRYWQRLRQPEKNDMHGSEEAGKQWWPFHPGQWMVSVLFVIYFVLLLQTVFFSREPGSRWGTQMQLLGTWGTTMQDHAWVLENVLLFIPFGILLPVCLPGRSHFLTVPAGTLCSVCIEYIQLRTGRGFCQLDDIVTNTLGAAVGYLLWWMLCLLCRGCARLWSQTVIRKRLFAMTAVLWMTVIFLFSSQPADGAGCLRTDDTGICMENAGGADGIGRKDRVSGSKGCSYDRVCYFGSAFVWNAGGRKYQGKHCGDGCYHDGNLCFN